MLLYRKAKRDEGVQLGKGYVLLSEKGLLLCMLRQSYDGIGVPWNQRRRKQGKVSYPKRCIKVV